MQHQIQYLLIFHVYILKLRDKVQFFLQIIAKISATILLTLTLASLGNRAVMVISQNMPPEREHCFIIDPGHGGVDGGATSVTGKLESTFNLEIGLRLRDY